MVIILISLVRHVLPGTSPSVTLVPYPSCPSFPQNMLILHGYCIPVNCMGTCVRSKQVICQGSIRRVCKCSMLMFNRLKEIFEVLSNTIVERRVLNKAITTSSISYQLTRQKSNLIFSPVKMPYRTHSMLNSTSILHRIIQ